MHFLHFSTGLMQVWNRPHCDWFTIRNAHFHKFFASVFWLFQSASFMNNFRKAVGLPIKFYLTSESTFFFFYTVGRNAPLRERISPSPFISTSETDLISILSIETCLCCPPESPFWFLSSPLGVLLPTSEIQGSWVKLHYCAPSDRHHYKIPISLYWVLVVACGIF